MVGYIGDTVTFVAMGVDLRGEVVHGAKFTWESSNSDKLSIDDAGRATLSRPGMVIVTCRAGLSEKVAPVLIRPARRSLQTDAQWRADQESLVSSTAGESGVRAALASLADKLAPTAHAQFNSWGDNPKAAQQIGTPPFAALEETRLGPVMPGSNFELPMPLVSLGGRGLGTSLMLYYNSNVWGAYFDPLQNSTVYAFDPIQSWPSPGFSLGFGRVTFYDYSYYDGVGFGYKYMLIDSNGTRHQLGIGAVNGNNVLQTTDGSHITYVGDVMSGTLHYNDGTAIAITKVNNRLLPTQITDTNGNYIQIAYKWETNFPPMAINYIVDTLGRVIQFHYDAYNSTDLTSITTPAGTVSLNYQTVTMNYSFVNGNPVENAAGSFSAVSSVSIPARPTYSFNYSGYGMVYNVAAASGGGTATVTFDYPRGGEQLIGLPSFSQRIESPNAVYTYGSDITRPDGTKLTLSSVLRELKGTPNQTLSRFEYTYTTDPGSSPAPQSVIKTDELGQQTKIDFDYDAYGNVVNKREYGFKINGQWQVRRRTHTTYVTTQAYIDSYLRNLPLIVEVYDSLGPQEVLVGKTVYAYDNYNVMGGMDNYGEAAAPPGHLTSYDTSKTTRGNLTGVTRYGDLAGSGVTENSKRDIFGGVTKAQMSCCNQKSFTMTEATYWSRSSQTTTGDTSGLYLTSSAVYDFNTLAAISNTDHNNQTTTYTYDLAQRPTGFTSATGANGSTSYNAWGETTSSTANYTEGGVNKSITSSAIYDGWGQMTSSVDAAGAQTNYTYDIMGWRLTQTNPFPQGGTPGPLTTYQYDQLGRVTVVMLPDGNTTQTTYAGANVVTVTDQVSRKSRRESDGLGRLIKVTEQNVSTGALSQETSYTYDAADHLIGVNQGGQTRAFKYDAEGRLLFEKIPERTPTIDDGGVPNQWTTAYTYASFGAIATRTDARGVVTNFGYDSMNRLISISYNTSGTPGVASTPNVTYNYDNIQGSATKGLLLSVSIGNGYSESYNYDSFKRVQSVTRVIEGRNYTTSLQFNTANQPTQMSYPSGRVINLGHDSKGRLTSVGSFLTGVTYNGIGQLTGTSLGNGVTETFGYDQNRMQLTSQTATKSGGPTNGLMNLTYLYQASAGQMGAGSTAGNAGQLMTIGGSIGGISESACYKYDNLSRLVTSDQTSNGASAQRRFAYDRWGNRTGMWDSVSGGNQIQSIGLEQSGGTPTNRITSVSAGKSTANYLYDASGNVTNDGSHVYQYDAENRIVKVDGGATAQYAYDVSNQRYKKVTGGSRTHYIWQGSQVIAEHNGSNGAVLIDYVSSGTRMIAKVEAGTTQYFLSDRLSPRLVLDTTGGIIGRQAHLPFGEDFGETGIQEKHHFTNYCRDEESSADYAVNRQYSKSLGRFLTVDADAHSATGTHPKTLNRYAYSLNDPVGNIDPLGLRSCSFSTTNPGCLVCTENNGSMTVDCSFNFNSIEALGINLGGVFRPRAISELEPKYNPFGDADVFDIAGRAARAKLQQEIDSAVKTCVTQSQIDFDAYLRNNGINLEQETAKIRVEGLEALLGTFGFSLPSVLGQLVEGNVSPAQLVRKLGSALGMVFSYLMLNRYLNETPEDRMNEVTLRFIRNASKEYGDKAKECIESRVKAIVGQ